MIVLLFSFFTTDSEWSRFILIESGTLPVKNKGVRSIDIAQIKSAIRSYFLSGRGRSSHMRCGFLWMCIVCWNVSLLPASSVTVATSKCQPVSFSSGRYFSLPFITGKKFAGFQQTSIDMLNQKSPVLYR